MISKEVTNLLSLVEDPALVAGKGENWKLFGLIGGI